MMKECTSCLKGEIEGVEATVRITIAPKSLIETHGRLLCPGHLDALCDDAAIMGQDVEYRFVS